MVLMVFQYFHSMDADRLLARRCLEFHPVGPSVCGIAAGRKIDPRNSETSQLDKALLCDASCGAELCAV